MATQRAIRLGTRGSALARRQADWVADQLRQLGHRVDLIVIQTSGDVHLGPLDQTSGEGLFTKEIQRALLDGAVDLAVHSLKDLPTDPVAGLRLAAVPRREAVSDVLVAWQARSLAELPQGARVASGSPRRRAQLLAARPDLELVEVRGNVDTRLRKLDEQQFDALVLAEAGLRRLGLSDRITQVLPMDVMLPAVGQGALGLEIRDEDSDTRVAVATLNDLASRQAVVAERRLLADLRGGCQAPVGAWGRVVEEELWLDVVVLDVAGRQSLRVQQTAAPDDAEGLGARAADWLLQHGAAELIAVSRRR
jgi:hydroxymethylbilane synthase